MIQIEEEFILKTLANAYTKYDEYKALGDEVKTLKIYGFCDGLERLVQKFAPAYVKEIEKMKLQSKISDKTLDNEIVNLDEPTVFRHKKI